MHAGIDLGSSLVKAVWKEEGKYVFASTADKSLEEIARELKQKGIKKLHLAGIGQSQHPALLSDFEISKIETDPIQGEIKLQAEGTKDLLYASEDSLRHFLLVSIGTGTSYAIVKGAETRKFQFGNSIGGGFIRGLTQILGAENYQEASSLAEQGKHLDICIKDVLAEKTGTFEGELVLANFGKGKTTSEKADIYASIMSAVAVATIRDILLINKVPRFSVPQNVVFIGSTVSRTPTLKKLLDAYSIAIGKKAHFPENGEYALAIGAYHMND